MIHISDENEALEINLALINCEVIIHYMDMRVMQMESDMPGILMEKKLLSKKRDLCWLPVVHL